VKRIRLLHIISSLKRGGAESVLVDLLRSLPHDQYEHHVIYFHDGPNRLHIQALGIATYHIRGLLYRYDPSFWWRLSYHVATINPDVIHSALWMASLSARILAAYCAIPLICSVHAQLSHHGKIRTLIDYYTYAQADAIVAVSDSVAQSLQALDSVAVQKIVVINNGIDVAAIHTKQHEQKKDRAALGLLAEHFVIGSVGRFVSVKLYDYLIAAYAGLVQRYSHVRLVLVGMGPLEHALRSQVKKLGLEQHVLFVVGDSAYGYYPLMDCFVLPSLQEGLSIALLEAMASKRACIVTSTDATHPVIEHQRNGLVIMPADIQQLVDAIRLLIDSPEVNSRLGVQAYDTVLRQFTLNNTVHSYDRLIKETIQVEI
jgi:glycosyltransferase involved in cell wall biosynthesis